MGKIIIGGILIAWGIGALLNISIMKFVFAIILIAIGVRIILGKESNFNNFNNFNSTKSTSNENYINEVNIFSSSNKVINSEDFKGGKITMIFSGGKIDISQVKTSSKDLDIEVVSMFGGAQLVVPKGWKVNSQGTSIFGGYDTKIEGNGGDVTLNLKGAAIFGGVKVTN